MSAAMFAEFTRFDTRQCSRRKSMNKLVAVALLAAGIALLIFGFNATNSLGSDISRFFTGSPTDRAIWMLVGGAVLSAAGLFGLTRDSR
jgi:Protein of unknown function (DUF3185)